MKKSLSSILIFIACGASGSVESSLGQLPTTNAINRPAVGSPYRYTGGWNSPSQQTQFQAPRSDAALSAVVQAAFYQSPGSGVNFPAYPGNEGGAPANNYSNGMNAMPPALPGGLPSSMPNALPVGQSNSLAGGFSNVELPSNMPPQNYPPNNQLVSPPAQQPFDPYAREQQQEVLPPNPMQSPYRNASTDLRAVQNSNQQYPVQQSPVNDLRPVAPTMQRGFGAAAQQMDVASGYPFVSPAPRTGNYPTSQYNPSLFRQVSYQNVVQSPQAPLNAAIANQQPTLLPQNSGVVGVYPTQYQCTPGTGVYPPPGAVPGTYVPPTLTPNLTPGTYSPNNSGYSPVFSLGQENYNVQIGRGIIGQPTVYVPGQPFRNFIRYLSP